MNRCRFCGRPDKSGECEKCAPTAKAPRIRPRSVRSALRLLSCAALEAVTNCQRSGVTAPEADEAQELLNRRECEGNCPCSSCSEEV